MTLQFKKVALATSILLSVATLSIPAYAADPMLSTGGYAREFQKMELMKILDGDGDHMVTTAEADSYCDSVFDALNKNGDDSLDASEWLAPTGKTKIDLTTGGYSRELRTMGMLKLVDTDGDKKVTRGEFLNYHRAFFTSKDTSGDQQISAQEWAAKGLLSK